MGKSKKEFRREMALKRARRNKTLIISACVLVVIGVIGFFVVQSIQRGDAVVYSNGVEEVKLYENGTFTASTGHASVSHSGTYEKYEEGGVEIIFFTESGKSAAMGKIDDAGLTLPEDWNDGHGHGVLPRK